MPDPFRYPLSARSYSVTKNGGVPGFIDDAMPDGWGGVFQGSCRVNRLTMLLFSQRFALDPGLTARCRSVPS
ncbi:hypothetical protein QCD78_25145, partial [Pseudomonas syringae pv. actinidiae]|nr:hypothetical protein [Pseudomonas syringae pv. actinidiae]MDG6421333.1 hypothetical protein [Pseudomonas syringae pv. actinidiae]MDG6426840.1 hypothetical protein [Pseudomonas syringae pv. actinidiae]MDG6436724.1 hypothetical protein [Pseudomonas syringae pv. actinidiae]MDG6442235.1 hypothetical protein [Pseudomonas syringae pv. actinidiae]